MRDKCVWLQERRGDDITEQCILHDLRTRYLHAMSAVFAEGFEKGYLSGEQHAFARSIISTALDHVDHKLQDFMVLKKLAHTPWWVRMSSWALGLVGRVVPNLRRWGEQARPSPSMLLRNSQCGNELCA